MNLPKTPRMKNLTIGQLVNICKENKYIIIRFADSQLTAGINCKVVLIQYRDKLPSLAKISNIESWHKANFSEYLTKKLPITN